MTLLELDSVEVTLRAVDTSPPRIPGLSGKFRAVDEEGNAANRSGGKVRVLEGINLTLGDGEVMALIGPTGCGKSTLIKAVAGLVQTSSGRVLMDQLDVSTYSPYERKVAVVFQEYALYPHMQSKGIMSFFLQVRNRDSEVPERVKQTVEIMGPGFANLLNRKPRELSGGQQQRVAIARCVIRNPNVFLFDEPLANLDAKLRSQTRIEIKKLLRKFKTTAIYCTHDQIEAASIGDRIAVMDAGRIVQVGTWQELYDRPHNTFVAGFLGVPPMALFSALVIDGKVIVGGVEFTPSICIPSINDGEQVTLGIRPEHVQITDAHSNNSFLASVESVQPDPGRRQSLVRFVVHHEPDLQGYVLVPSDFDITVGEETWIRFPDERISLFDNRSVRIS
tara:strand:- start:539 stop:1714 length:1176 start_codon:yes stop_codon:yes gene_type:complete